MFDREHFYIAWTWNAKIPDTKRGRIMQMTIDCHAPLPMLITMTRGLHHELNVAGVRTACRILSEFDEFMQNRKFRNRVMKRWCEFAELSPDRIPKEEPPKLTYYAHGEYPVATSPQKSLSEIKPLDWTLFYSNLLGLAA